MSKPDYARMPIQELQWREGQGDERAAEVLREREAADWRIRTTRKF